MDIEEKDSEKIVAKYEATPDDYGTASLRNTARMNHSQQKGTQVFHITKLH